MKPQRTTKPLSWKKKLGFAVLSTCLFLLLLEGVLALVGTETSLEQSDPYVGFEASIPLFVAKEGSEGDLLTTADNKLRYFNSQQFPRDKPENTCRIFCLGGSTTYGRPYNDSTSYCAWLRELLKATSDGRNYEVINAGGISYASYRVAAVMEELTHYNPDVFIVYCGHNEFLEERTYRDLRQSSENGCGLSLLLHRSRTFQLARELLADPAPPEEDRFILPAEVDAILDHSAGPISYQRNDLLRDQILEHYRLNLSRMIYTAREAGAELVFVTPAANVKDFSPFKSESLETLSPEQRQEWNSLVRTAAEHQERGELEQAISQLEAAVQIDPRHAEVRYQLGQLLFRLERYTEADREFQAAIDNDICPLRATSEIREMIRQTAVEQFVPLVDFAAILRDDCEQAAGHGSPGNDYFLDHVHPTIEVHRLLALALLDALSRMNVVPPDDDGRETGLEAASRTIEARIDPSLNSQALTNLSQVLYWAGKRDEAGRLALAALEMRNQHQLKDDPESLFYAANYLGNTEETARAEAFYRRILELQPELHQARWHLAELLSQVGEFQAAKRELDMLVNQAPENPRYLQALGQVLLKLEQYGPAVSALEQAEAIDPDLPGLQDNLEESRQQLKRADDSVRRRAGSAQFTEP